MYILSGVLFSAVHLTTRLLRQEPGRREQAAYDFGLPADKPLMSQLIIICETKEKVELQQTLTLEKRDIIIAHS